MKNVISVDHEARSRRNFFAKAGALLATAGLAAPSVLESQTLNSDVDILNYALRLERLEASFYANGLAKFAASDFAASNFAKNLTPAQVANAYALVTAIGQQELSHVNQISAAIGALNGTLAQPDCYVFQPYGSNPKLLANADSFIATAMVLENTGVTAYDGAISLLQSASLRTTAATIATVEGRHAAYLNQLMGASPFPSAYDTPATAATILAAASAYLASSCPTYIAVVVGPQNVTTFNKTLQLSATATSPYPPLSYVWEPVLGEMASVDRAQYPDPTVTFLGGPGVYNFAVVVTDYVGNTGSAHLAITYTGS
jgi:hypothetical protein